MDIRQLRYFFAAAERLHFTRPAGALNVAQPALSQQIALLEQEIGVRLLERTNRQVQQTPAGQAFRKKALLALQQNKIDLGITSFFLNHAGLEAKMLSRKQPMVALPEGIL